MTTAFLKDTPQRLIWGSDWPHVKLFKVMPSDGDLVNRLANRIPAAKLCQLILIDHPIELYAFTR